MTEAFAYNGESTSEFENGKTYVIAWDNCRDFIHAVVIGGDVHHYSSLREFLLYWTPVAPSEPAGDGSHSAAEHGGFGG